MKAIYPCLKMPIEMNLYFEFPFHVTENQITNNIINVCANLSLHGMVTNLECLTFIIIISEYYHFKKILISFPFFNKAIFFILTLILILVYHRILLL